MVTTFIYKPSWMRIDARNRPTHKHTPTHPHTDRTDYNIIYSPVWSGSTHIISSYHVNRPTHKHTHRPTHPHTNRQDRLQYTAPQLACSVITVALQQVDEVHTPSRSFGLVNMKSSTASTLAIFIAALTKQTDHTLQQNSHHDQWQRRNSVTKQINTVAYDMFSMST